MYVHIEITKFSDDVSRLSFVASRILGSFYPSSNGILKAPLFYAPPMLMLISSASVFVSAFLFISALKLFSVFRIENPPHKSATTHTITITAPPYSMSDSPGGASGG